ncbi:type 4a pilus biogenesis protein PilO [Ampullimonas aquatilis]|uniref:type 4a pilus biogenesis protein PilO n=1 Tax=Ampullimonas aquatilis TaxID=1341549 RepID=UPI003C760EF6
MAIDIKELALDAANQFKGLNTEDPGTWPILPKIVSFLFVIALVIGLAWYLYVSDQLTQLDNSKQQELALRDEYKSKLQQAVNLEELKKQKEQVAQYVTLLEKQLPSKAEMDALLSDINQAGLGRGLQFELFKPGQVNLRDYYAELPINIKINGNYHDIASFTSDIAHLPRIVTLNNMNITVSKDSVLQLEAIAKTFRYLDSDEVAAQRKAAAEKAAKEGGK